VVVKICVFWDITPVFRFRINNVSEENMTSIFRIEE
jgi:hypothetical protein